MSKESTPPTDHYWRANLRITFLLLIVWASVSLGCGIFAADWLNQFKLPGTHYPLGFWFAHQGSIVVFVIIILIYALLLNRLDRKHRAALEAQRSDTNPEEQEVSS